ncbi:hypothetical protein ABT369_37460 [Dactylosporangium sp. NPDC000244]|uniref:hypothetical protein n=1 Tax=Dactylosporangium sp. NPDC000244 TaxID=3154365 RepID=UPI00332BF329
MRRFVPVTGLLLLAPLVGEYLLGNISVRALPALPFLVPMYGAGALLIRELARRTGRGYPAILLLGAAYGVIEAGLVDQSMFNPSFEGHDFQAVTPIPAWGLSAASALAFVAGHAIWSITVPIALMEQLNPIFHPSGEKSDMSAGSAAKRPTYRPWLSRRGLAATALVYLLGCWIIHKEITDSEHFTATQPQRLGAATAAAILIALAFLRPRPGTWPAPKVWLTGVIAFGSTTVFFARPESWAGFWFGVVWLAAGAAWLARTRWTDRHVRALASGALLTYAWSGFALTALMEPHDPVRWWGNAAFAAGAVALVFACFRRRTAAPAHGPASAGSSSD